MEVPLPAIPVLPFNRLDLQGWLILTWISVSMYFEECITVLCIADIDYDDTESEDEDSDMATRNIFIWLREEDGLREQENIGAWYKMLK